MGDTTTVDNAKLIEQMLEDAKGTPRTGEGTEPILHRGDGTLPSPMVMRIDDPGLVTVYRTKTGDALSVLRTQLPQLLRVKEDDGTPRFTTVKPSIVPKRGTLKCLLHGEGENREHYDQLGLPTCRKSNLTSPYMVEMHMRKRHPSAWATIESEKKEAEKQEEREFQRSIIKGIQAGPKQRRAKRGSKTEEMAEATP